MFKWTVIFLVIAAVSGALGFGVLSAEAAGLAKTLCYAFLAMALVCGGCGVFELRRAA